MTSEGHVCHVDEGSGSPTHVNRLDDWVKMQLLDRFGRILELVLAMDMKLIGGMFSRLRRDGTAPRHPEESSSSCGCSYKKNFEFVAVSKFLCMSSETCCSTSMGNINFMVMHGLFSTDTAAWCRDGLVAIVKKWLRHVPSIFHELLTTDGLWKLRCLRQLLLPLSLLVVHASVCY